MKKTRNQFSLWLEKKVELKTYKEDKQEILNAWTHLIGAALAFAGIIAILIKGLQNQSPNLGASLLFGFSMFILYLSSGIYHLSKPGTLKRIGRVMDHINIYLLIAGTYTPIVSSIQDPKLRAYIWVVWALTLFGILFTLIFWGKFKVFHVLSYLILGWCIVPMLKPMSSQVPPEIIPCIFIGGLSYTIGVLFYAIKKIPYNHVIWHLFVIGGSTPFFIGVYFYLLD